MIMGDIMISRDAELNVVAIYKVQVRVVLFLHNLLYVLLYKHTHYRIE